MNTARLVVNGTVSGLGQIQALEEALETAARAIAPQIQGDFIVGVCFPAPASAPAHGTTALTSMSYGVGQFAGSTLRPVPADVELVELVPRRPESRR